MNELMVTPNGEYSPLVNRVLVIVIYPMYALDMANPQVRTPNAYNGVMLLKILL
jgi:hypothetical protein